MGPKLRQELKDALVLNRSAQDTGSGNAYWESVIDVIENFLDRHFK